MKERYVMEKIKDTPVIWALFDDGNGSWNKLGVDNIYSFGINDNPDWKNYFKVDLSVSNLNLLEDLDKIAKITGKPDIIIAHPPCESWSVADNQRRTFRDIKRLSDWNNKALQIEVLSHDSIRDLNEFVNVKNQKHLLRKPNKQFGRFLIGLGTAYAVKIIQEYYEPAITIIENPQTSKIWDFYRAMSDRWSYRPNLTYYNKWNNNYTPKPTIFTIDYHYDYYCNCAAVPDIYFPAETTKYTPNKKTLTFGRNGTVSMSYDQKSSVPKELVEWLYKELMIKWGLYYRIKEDKCKYKPNEFIPEHIKAGMIAYNYYMGIKDKKKDKDNE